MQSVNSSRGEKVRDCQTKDEPVWADKRTDATIVAAGNTQTKRQDGARRAREAPNSMVKVLGGLQSESSGANQSGRIAAYLATLRLQGYSPLPRLDAAAPAEPGLKGVGKRLVPARLRPYIKAAMTSALKPVSTRTAPKLLSRYPEPKLHLGCGPTHLEGWINVDLAGEGADLAWDLRLRLPFPNSSAAVIIHEHLLEHLSTWEALQFLRECRRLLRPLGVLRLGVPDFGLYARDYVSGGTYIAGVRPDRPTPLLALAEIVYGYQHRSVWDSPTILAVLEEVGFLDGQVCDPGESTIQPAPDSDHRKAETVYVEAFNRG